MTWLLSRQSLSSFKDGGYREKGLFAGAGAGTSLNEGSKGL